jgi:hypothetical protein
VHRSGRTGRAGRHGTVITFFTKNEEAELRNIERRVGIKFKMIGTPQPPELVAVGAEDAFRRIGAVHPTQIKLFAAAATDAVHTQLNQQRLEAKKAKKASKKSKKGDDNDDDDDDDSSSSSSEPAAHGKSAAKANGNSATSLDVESATMKLLAGALAVLAGCTQPLPTRSLLTSMEGYVTLQLTNSQAMHSSSFVAGGLRRLMPELDFREIQLAQRTATRALVDVREDQADRLLDAGRLQYFQIQLATEIPDLMPKESNRSAAVGGGFGGRGGGGGRLWWWRRRWRLWRRRPWRRRRLRWLWRWWLRRWSWRWLRWWRRRRLWRRRWQQLVAAGGGGGYGRVVAAVAVVVVVTWTRRNEDDFYVCQQTFV